MAKKRRDPPNPGPGWTPPQGPTAASSPRLSAGYHRWRWAVIGLVGVVVLTGVAVPLARWWFPKAKPPAPTVAAPYSRPVGVAPGYVTSTVCAECHPAQHRDWVGSHHEQAMQPATAETVRGNFNNVRLSDRGVASRFFSRCWKFFVNTEGRDCQPSDFELRYTFGVAPLQQYLVESPGGRLQGLTVAWHSARKRWFSLYPNERFAPDDPL